MHPAPIGSEPERTEACPGATRSAGSPRQSADAVEDGDPEIGCTVPTERREDGGMSERHLCVIGDVHGHLQLALLVAARWQQDLGVEFDAVLLAGDVGTFPSLAALDSATRKHAMGSPCEIEFAAQWMSDPPAPHLARILAPLTENGCGLRAPVVMVSGNHEGFEHLDGLAPDEIPDTPVAIGDLPRVDPAGRLLLLPGGWRTITPSGLVIGGLGGIERDQRYSYYHDMAYITDDQVLAIAAGDPVDLLVTHSGPAITQPFPSGAELLDIVADAGVARVWCHGHSVNRDRDFVHTHRGTPIVPLHDATFGRGPGPTDGDPGDNAWCHLTFDGDNVVVNRERPWFWRDYHRRNWRKRADGQLVAPQLL